MYVPPNSDLDSLSEDVHYVGSPEHKDIPSFAGQPRLRADASCCPRNLADVKTLTDWLRTAVKQGAVGPPWEGLFPRYVWYKHGDTVFEGRLVNRGSGSYKGYPLGGDEWPEGIELKYGTASV